MIVLEIALMKTSSTLESGKVEAWIRNSIEFFGVICIVPFFWGGLHFLHGSN